jgi:hypothetical protein
MHDERRKRKELKRQRLFANADANTTALQTLVASENISRVGLERVLGQIKENPQLLEATSQGLQDANAARFQELRHVERVETEDGGVYDWEFADPNRLLQTILKDCPGFAAEYLRAATNHPVRPWRLLVQFDEFTPGDKLKSNNRRKTMTLSFSFEDQGF